MNLIKEIGFLIKKEILLEWRQKYAIGGIVLYVFSTIFIVYTAAVKVQPNIWYVLFWIIILFASVNAVLKSFVQENGARQLYYYQLIHPVAIILAKIIYNSLLLIVLSFLSYLVFSIVTINPVKDYALFFGILTLGSLGFGIALTFISAIASKANQNATLMAILSFPVVIPILMTLVKLSANALRLLQDTSISKDISILIAIDLMLLGMAVILFPFLWRD